MANKEESLQEMTEQHSLAKGEAEEKMVSLEKQVKDKVNEIDALKKQFDQHKQESEKQLSEQHSSLSASISQLNKERDQEKQ